MRQPHHHCIPLPHSEGSEISRSHRHGPYRDRRRAGGHHTAECPAQDPVHLWKDEGESLQGGTSLVTQASGQETVQMSGGHTVAIHPCQAPNKVAAPPLSPRTAVSPIPGTEMPHFQGPDHRDKFSLMMVPQTWPHGPASVLETSAAKLSFHYHPTQGGFSGILPNCPPYLKLSYHRYVCLVSIHICALRIKRI